MRPACLECAGKHVAQACVLMKETKTGYPAFKWFVIGHLAEAEEETVREHPALANEIREYRVAYSVDQETIIPFEELLARIDELLEYTDPTVMDDAGETKHIQLPGAVGTEPSPVGEFGQTDDMPSDGDLGTKPL